MLETEEKTFTAVSAMHKGTLNSALFCQEVANYLLTNYADRFSLYEGTNVKKIILRKDHAILDAESFTVVTPRVVLCTNGFENMDIFNHSGLDIDKHFHHEITGIVARMSGYLEKLNKPPMAISYYVTPELGFDNMEDPYFYFTRREYEYEKGTRHNLICIGGPQHSIADREEYLYEFDYPEEVQKEINEFVKKTYDSDPNHHIDYKFTWHGLMGYTRNRIRLIGEEKKNPVLMYNLGCNGVGILPSIFGGKRITDMIAGKKIVPMIFDPK
jgi:glycine/D-amino acid oxidase-like deaminating enzyme